MKKLLLFAGILSAGLASQAQELCSQYEMQERLYNEHPEMRIEAERAHEANIKASAQYMRPATKAVKYTIPVVFHIIHEPGDETANVSDEQIYEAIEISNLNFRGQNPSVGTVLPEFQDRIAMMDDLELVIATIDPDGNCTNGINRYEQALPNGGTDTEYKSGRQWPTNQYLNIYIVPKIASGAAGYAYYPANGNQARDGIVLLYNYLGSTGESNFNRSFTLAHEAGHYLGLPHVWGNSNNTDIPSNCNVDDGIQDTPLTQGSSTCDPGRETCGSLDNVQNFMDYSYCSFMFTEGQGAVVRAALESTRGGRNNLWTPANIAATGTDYEGESPDFLCAADFSIPGTDTYCPGEEVYFVDRSYFGVDGWTWSFPGGEPATSTDQFPIVTYAEPGVYDVTLTVTKGVQEETITKTAVVNILDKAYTAPLLETFDNIAFLDDEQYFSVFNEDGLITWEQNGNVGYDADESSLYIASRFIGTNGDGLADELISGPIDLTNMTNPTIGFEYAYARRSAADQGQLIVSVSEDCGKNFTVLRSIIRNSLVTAPDEPASEFVPSGQDEWKTFTRLMSQYAGKVVRIKLAYVHDGGNHIYLDNFRVREESAIGVEEISNSNDLSVYPNPNQGSFTLSGINPSDVEQINVVDVLGKQQQIKSQTSGANVRVNMASDFQAGVYFVNVSFKNGESALRKISVLK